MKKIIGLVLACVMAFGFVGCSNDSSSDNNGSGSSKKTETNPQETMDGYWSYRVINTSGDTGIYMSINKEGASSLEFGAPDYMVNVSNGEVALYWNGQNGVEMELCTRKDCPTIESLGLTLADGEAIIFVFTPYKSVNLYCYAMADGAFVADTYPGVETTVPMWSMFVKGIVFKNVPDFGTAGYIAVCEAWIPGNEWGSATPNKIVDKDNPVITFESLVTLETNDDGAFVKVQILNPNKTVNAETGEEYDDFWNDKTKLHIQNEFDTAYGPKEACKDKTLWLVIDFEAKTMAFEE